MELKGIRTILLNEGDPEKKRAEILNYFHRTFDLDETLYDTLKDDDTFYLRADRLRHPLVFYLGHTAAFYINKLVISRIIDSRIDPRLESLFAVGVDEMSWDDLDKTQKDWPKVGEVKAYRSRVRQLVDEVIRTEPLTLPIGWENPFWVIMMGIEHERIHLETSSVLIRQLPADRVRPHPFWEICTEAGEPPENMLIPVPGGRVPLGRDFGDELYGWDNEYGRHEKEVQGFFASKYLVSNREFLAFVEAGGYAEEGWWTEEGWKWRTFRGAEHPLFWVERDHGFALRTMLQVIDMPWNWPAEVNYHEAKAFCNWLAAASGRPIRLPGEEEWRRLHDVCRIPDLPQWEKAPGNLNLEQWCSPCPVDRFGAGSFFDVVGNVWQWTETPIYPFRGFRVHPSYDDFSTPTFDTRHNLLKGGSWISTGNLATRDARYAFRRHFFQHAGFRYIESAAVIEQHEDQYETDELAAQYCDAHYGTGHFGVPNSPKTTAEICLEVSSGRRRESALDVGCAVGRATFELARGYARVTGVDLSSRFFRLAARMQEEGYLRYAVPDEGEILSYHEVSLEGLNLGALHGTVEFYQADACNLPPNFTGYDLVLASNLIDRLYTPRAFLAAIHERINPGGLLVIASPYSWSEEFTKKSEWIGGYKEAGENVTTLDGLKALLTPHFRLLREPRDIPFTLRETQRKYQHCVAEMTIWELK